MSVIQKHLRLAERNHLTLMVLCEDEKKHAEWISTVAFYKAIQLIEALLLAETGRNSHDHKTRLRILKVSHQEIFKHFRHLYAASTVARYLCDQSADGGNKPKFDSFSDYFSNNVVECFVQKRLKAVEDYVFNRLKGETFTRVNV